MDFIHTWTTSVDTYFVLLLKRVDMNFVYINLAINVAGEKTNKKVIYYEIKKRQKFMNEETRWIDGIQYHYSWPWMLLVASNVNTVE